MPAILDTTMISTSRESRSTDSPSFATSLKHSSVRTVRQRAFTVIHDLAYSSGRVTSKMLQAKYIWPGIRKDAISRVRQCIPCQRVKISRHTRATVKSIPVPDQRFDHVHIDLIILLQVGTLRYCLTIIDRFSSWPIAIPLSNMEAPTIAEAFYNH